MNEDNRPSSRSRRGRRGSGRSQTKPISIAAAGSSPDHAQQLPPSPGHPQQTHGQRRKRFRRNRDSNSNGTADEGQNVKFGESAADSDDAVDAKRHIRENKGVPERQGKRRSRNRDKNAVHRPPTPTSHDPHAQQHRKSSPSQPQHPRQPLPSTLVVNPYVRCMATNRSSSDFSSVRSLRDLLKQGTDMFGKEADTPLLGPKDMPESAEKIAPIKPAFDRNNAEGGTQEPPLLPVTVSGECLGSMDSNNNNQMVFSVDSIATPNTFKSLSTSVPSLAAPQSKSFFTALMNDFDADKKEFRWSATAEGKRNFVERLAVVCHSVLGILESSCLMAAVTAPVYVFGDIHGNFEDLGYFLNAVLPFGDINLSPCNVLCLGDYVDRGPNSLECIALLFALKVEAPHKVTLLRGNHEDRVVCGDKRTYGSECFLAQCQTCLGPVEGMKVFMMVTAVFKHLPLAAEIIVSSAPNVLAPRSFARQGSDVPGPVEPPPLSLDAKPTTHQSWRKVANTRHNSHVERILCTHGGIPRFNAPPEQSDSLAFLRSPEFPRLMTLFPHNPLVRNDHEVAADGMGVPEDVLQRAWLVMFDLMWSDPTTDESCVNDWGFGMNNRGNNVVSFSTKAVDTFLSAFRYSMLFRAHQEKAHGIRLSKSQKVITIFSSSNYLGHGNGAGCVIVTATGEVQLVIKRSS